MASSVEPFIPLVHPPGLVIKLQSNVYSTVKKVPWICRLVHRRLIAALLAKTDVVNYAVGAAARRTALGVPARRRSLGRLGAGSGPSLTCSPGASANHLGGAAALSAFREGNAHATEGIEQRGYWRSPGRHQTAADNLEQVPRHQCVRLQPTGG